MTPGVLWKVFDKEVLEATIGPDGWSSKNAPFADQLTTLYPPGGTVAGFPWVRAFWDAVAGSGCDVVTEPVPDDPGPGVIY